LDCINSARLCKQIIVLDSLSTDATKDIVIKEQIELIQFDWNGEYPKKRQWALDNLELNNEWILFLDADERLTEDLLTELEVFLNESSHRFSAVLIPISYYFAGKRLRFGQVPRKIVFFKRNCVYYPVISDLTVSGMGELEGHYQPQVIGEVRKARNRIIHNDRDPISSWAIRHVNYANWEAHLILNEGDMQLVSKSKSGFTSLVHKSKFRSLLFFIYSYILRFGFLDGRAGFDYAFGKAWYYWLSDVIAREKGLSVKD
jgi:glycosyltransferase involved in cell wall biosynthesis